MDPNNGYDPQPNPDRSDRQRSDRDRRRGLDEYSSERRRTDHREKRQRNRESDRYEREPRYEERRDRRGYGDDERRERRRRVEDDRGDRGDRYREDRPREDRRSDRRSRRNEESRREEKTEEDPSLIAAVIDYYGEDYTPEQLERFKSRKSGGRSRRRRRRAEPAFSMGDKVVVREDGEWVDEVGTIIDVGKKMCWVEFEDGEDEYAIEDIKPQEKKRSRRRRKASPQKEPTPPPKEEEEEAAQPTFNVGDKVKAPYDGEMFPGTIEDIQGDTAHVAFKGYDDFEPEEVPLADCVLREDDDEEEEEEVQPEEPEEEKIDERNIRPEAPAQKFEGRDAVYVFPLGEKRMPDNDNPRNQWLNGTRGFVRGFDAERDTYTVEVGRGRDREKQRGIKPSQMLAIRSNQDKGRAVFMVLKKKKIMKNEWFDYFKTLWGVSGRFGKILQSREGEHIFDEIVPMEDVETEEEIEWREDVPLPEMEWWCPLLPEVIVGTGVDVVEEGESYRGRVKGYDWDEATYEIQFRKGDDKFTIHKARSEFTISLTFQDKAKLIFGALQKRCIDTRLFQGMWRVIVDDGRRPPDLEKICELPNGTEWDQVEDCDSYIKWIGKELPPQPDKDYHVPAFFPFDSVNVVGSKVPGCKRKQARGRVNMEPWDPKNNKYVVNVRVYNDDDEDDDGFEEHDLPLGKEDLSLIRDAAAKARIVFGSFQTKKVSQKDFKLACLLFFNDKVRNLGKFAENSGCMEVEDEGKRMCCWDEDSLPPRPSEQEFAVAPRNWPNKKHVEVLRNGRWERANVVEEIGYNEGQYRVNKDDDVWETNATQMRKIINIDDKIKAVFASLRPEDCNLSFDALNDGMFLLFGDNGVSNWDRLSDRLAERNITVDEDMGCVTLEELPREDIMEVWEMRDNMSFMRKIELVFKTIGKQTVEYHEFNERMNDMFEDEIADFERALGSRGKYSIDNDNETVTFERSLDEIAGMDDEAVEMTWTEKFKDKEKNWEATENQDRVKASDLGSFKDSTVDGRTVTEMKDWLEQEQINYHTKQGEVDMNSPDFQRPAQTFEEAFNRFEQDPNLRSAAGGILAELNRQFEKPTPVQSACWPMIFCDRDVLGISKTGSGKTYTFGLPTILKCVQQNSQGSMKGSFGNYCHALIVVPTRELAQQHEDMLSPWGAQCDVKVHASYGGQSKRDSIQAIEAGVDIVIATVGRLLDLLQGGDLDLKNTTIIILDEADEMLRGFPEQIREVLMHQIRPDMERQCLLFSATYPEEVIDLEHAFYRNKPIRITIGNKTVLADKNVMQHFAMVDERKQMLPALIATLKHLSASKAKVVVFFNSKDRAEEAAGDVKDRADIRVKCIHSGMDQPMRTRVLEELKTGRSNIVFATDLIARGIDIDKITVVQYEFPFAREDAEDNDARERYIHRMGRSGRANNVGACYTIDFRTPEWDLYEVITDAEKVGPELLYSRLGQSAPDDVRLPADVPEWAGGLSMLESFAENSGYSVIPTGGKGTRLFEAMQYHIPDLNVSQLQSEHGTDIQLDQLVDLCGQIGHHVTVFDLEELAEWTQHTDTAGDNSGVWLVWANERTNNEGEEFFQPLVDNDVLKQKSFHVPPSSSSQNWTNQRCNAFLEEFNATFPGMCIDDDGTNATVVLDDYPEEQYTIPSTALKAELDNKLANVASSAKIGLRVKVTYSDGNVYDGVIEDDFMNDSYMVLFDDFQENGAEEISGEQIEWPVAAPASSSSAFVAGASANVWFEESEAYLPGTIVAVNADGTFKVTYDGFPEEYDVTGDFLEGFEAQASSAWSVGQSVEAKYEADGVFYAATISAVNGDSLTVAYTDFENEEAIVSAADVRAVAAGAFAVDQAVMAKYEADQEFYAAKILSIDNGSYTVAFTDFENEEAVVAEADLKAAEGAPASESWVGLRVNGLFDGEWFPATVNSQNADGTYQVTFDGFENEETLEEGALQELEIKTEEVAKPPAPKYKVGESVEALFADDGEWYSAQVTEASDGSYTIVYPDFGEDTYTVTEENLRALKEKVPREKADPGKSSHTYSVGQSDLEALFEEAWYSCQVVSVDENGYVITYPEFDDTQYTVSEESIRVAQSENATNEVGQENENPPAAYAVNAQVSCYYEAEESYLPATIQACNADGTYQIFYNGFEDDILTVGADYFQQEG